MFKMELEIKKNKESKIKEVLRYFNVEASLDFVHSRAEHKKFFVVEVPQGNGRFYDKRFLRSVELEIKNKCGVKI